MSTRRRRRTLQLGTLACLGLLLALAPRLLPPYPAREPGGDAYPAEKLADRLDPWLLAEGFAQRTVVEIDWIEGCKPGPRTIAALEAVLEEYSPPDRTTEVVLDEEIPRSEWGEHLPDGPTFEALLARHAGIARYGAPGTEWRYALFVPEMAGYFGHTIDVPVARDGATIHVPGLVVARDEHARFARLWISLDGVEQMTLVHEFGHLLGLVENPRHERASPYHRLHCNALDCPMAHPTLRVIARNFLPGLFNRFMSDYCAACRDDIRRAQAYWRDRAREGTAYRERREAERAARRMAPRG